MRTYLLIAASLSALLAVEDATVPALSSATPSPIAQTNAGQTAFLRSLASAPVIQAAQERVLAARRSANAAGRLPDPMLGGGYSRRSSTMDRWPMYEAMLEQPLPRWGERDAMRAKAAAETAMSEAELLDMLGETAAEVAAMLAEAEAARARLALTEAQINRVNALQATIAARVAAGTSGIAEQLGVKSRLAALIVERDTMQRMVADAEQDVRGRLGMTATMPLPPFTAPDRTSLTLDRVPGVLAAQAKTADADAMFREARASRYPETSIGLSYEREEVPEDPMNTIGLTFRISLPVWQNASSHLEESASARRRAAQRDAAGWQYRAQSLLGRAERASTVAATARKAAQDTKARLDVEYDAMIRAAAVQNGTNLIAVLEVLDRVSDAERMVIEAEAAAHQAGASLWRLTPPDLSIVTSERNQP